MFRVAYFKNIKETQNQTKQQKNPAYFYRFVIVVVEFPQLVVQI